MLEKSEDSDAETDESVAVAAMLESSELRDDERLDKAPEAALVTPDTAELAADAAEDNREVGVASVVLSDV